MFFQPERGVLKGTASASKAREPLVPAVTTAEGCGLRASCPWQVPVLHWAAVQMTGLTPFLLCVRTDFLSNLRAEQK